MVSQVTNHVEAGLDLLLDQYKNKPRIAALLTSYLKRIQELEDATWDVLIGRLIDYAEGYQLDALGKLVGQARLSPDDELYRARIRTRIRANRSDGHPTDIIEVAALALALDASSIKYQEHFPASFTIDAIGQIDPEIAAIASDFLQIAKPPGVSFALIFSEFPVEDTFAFADGDVPVVDPSRGFTDDEDPTDAPGGRWVDTV